MNKKTMEYKLDDSKPSPSKNFDFDKWLEDNGGSSMTWKDELIYYLIDKPVSIYRSIVSGIIHWEQRRVRGWDDSDTWSLDHTFALFILPRLKRYREVNNGYPSELTEKKWNDILDKMILGFTIMADESKYYDLTCGNGKLDDKITITLKLFSTHCRDLWW